MIWYRQPVLQQHGPMSLQELGKPNLYTATIQRGWRIRKLLSPFRYSRSPEDRLREVVVRRIFSSHAASLLCSADRPRDLPDPLVSLPFSIIHPEAGFPLFSYLYSRTLFEQGPTHWDPAHATDTQTNKTRSGCTAPRSAWSRSRARAHRRWASRS